MQLSHVVPVRSAVFDEPNLVSHAGLGAGDGFASAEPDLIELADRHIERCPAGPGHAAGLKVSALVGGMVAGADSISDMAVLRHGGMCQVVHAGCGRHRRWARSCGLSGSVMSGSWTRSRPGS